MPQTDQAGSSLRPMAWAQHQRRLKGRGVPEAEADAGDGAAVVVEDDGQPRLGRPAALIEQPEVELGVVGLPELIRPARVAAIQQVERLPVGLGPIVRQRNQGRVEPADDGVDGAVARGGPALPRGDRGHLPMDGGHRRWGRAQGEALNESLQLRCQAPLPPVGARGTGESRQAVLPVGREPVLGPAQREPLGGGRTGQGDAILEMGPQQREAPEGLRPSGLGQAGQGGGSTMTHSRSASRSKRATAASRSWAVGWV